MDHPVKNDSFGAQDIDDDINSPAAPFLANEGLVKRSGVGRREAELMACVAHEMRTPLCAIRMATAFLSQGGSEATARSRRIIDLQTDHLLRMIDDLLELARGRVGHVRLDPVHVDLSEVVREVIEARAPQLQGRRQSVRTEGVDKPMVMLGDPMRLAQIIANLIDNASKFSADGQVVRLSLRRRSHTVEVSVSDDGIGIEASALDRVFNLFEQGVRSSRGDHSGLGIGLAIARELTELHGGRIVAESAGPGLGSRFVVTLPAHLELTRSSTSAPPVPWAAAAKARAAATPSTPAGP